jgi:hypothetical protein
LPNILEEHIPAIPNKIYIIKSSHNPLKMVISVTIKSYEFNKRFNVTMNSVEDKVLALKLAISDAINRDHAYMKYERFHLVRQTSLKWGTRFRPMGSNFLFVPTWAIYHFFQISLFSQI